MFDQLIGFLSNPLVLKVMLGYWIFSAFVGAMPSPDLFAESVKSGAVQMFYRFLFAFLHGISGNLSRAAIALKVPGAIEDKP